MYRLLATDLDGTLFTSDTTVSEKNRKAILKASERGISIVLCSGRAPYEGVSALGESLGLNRPGNYYICCSGALIVDAATLEICAGNFLPKNTAAELLHRGEEFFVDMGRAAIRLHTTRQMYARYREVWDNDIERRTGKHFLPLPEDISAVEGEITKILFLSPQDGYAMRFYDRMEEVLPKGALGYRMPPALAEYVAADANKGHAVEQLAEILGLSPEETVCVGDGWNDISMLTGKGLGVAVRNAPEEVARHADVVLDRSNNEDAIAAVLERWF
ncbi:MAG: Cof-type HAD-IIB family hydrolase [Candidatus Merdivicinus sp.]|jgi:Cof subfamily protein (haloacid dehalogenase superfamily)